MPPLSGLDSPCGVAVDAAGDVLVADTQLVSHWYGALLNPVFRLGGRPWIPASLEGRYWSHHPLDAFTAATAGFLREEWFGGSVYVAWGQRPEGTGESMK